MGWIPLGEAAKLRYCCARGSASTTNLPNGTTTKLPLNTWITRSDSELYTFSNNGVKIAEAGKYLVAANIYFTGPTKACREIYLLNETNKQLHAAKYSATGAAPQGAVCLPMKTVTLSADTTLMLNGKQSFASSAGTMYPSNAGTYLTIIKIA